ncbi:uncharacterized protein ATC70_004075 [Mucor velutinosus]|uniref:Uncharacterized protein n=2 Tax=Mucor velutinosus TaxID=708070 RepID=A0AAN7DT79_9FUNG|nr:hypothetical protein ATC70_004075 [Mucor velutinosus]
MDQAQQLFLQRLENIEQELSNLSKQVKECNDNQTEVKAMLQHIVQQSTSSSTANVARLDGVICRPSKADSKHLEELSVELCINVLEEHRLGGENLDGKKVWELVKDAAYNQAKKADRQFPNITFSKLDNRFQALLIKTVIDDVAKKGVDISGFFKDWLPQFAVSKSLSGIIDYKYNARPSNDTATYQTQFDEDDLVFSEGSQAQSEEDSVDDDENSIVDKINFHVSRNTGSQKRISTQHMPLVEQPMQPSPVSKNVYASNKSKAKEYEKHRRYSSPETQDLQRQNIKGPNNKRVRKS